MDLSPLMRLGLLLARAGMVIAATPAFGGQYAPAATKVGLVVLVALVLLPVVAVPTAIPMNGIPVVLFRELAIGLALAMSVRVLLAGVELAGHLTGFQLGFSYAAVVDPNTGVRNNTVAAMYGTLALLTFLGIDGHHAVLRALVASYAELPIGLGHVSATIVPTVTRMLGVIFTTGAQIAAPVAIVLLLVELGLGLIVRSAQGFDFMAISFPARLLVGTIALAAAVGVVPTFVSPLTDRLLRLASALAAALR